MIFFDLLRPSPQMKMMMVTSHADDLAYQLCEHLQGCNGSVDLSRYPGVHQNVEHEVLSKSELLKNFSSPPRGTSRDYEAVIVHDVLHLHELPLKFLQLIYRLMENSAEIIIIQVHGVMEVGEVESLLEQAEFRAPNTIYDLLEGHDVIVAKKMHMWGNGL
ncbi:MAG: hypothetical protein PHQ22_01790 [Sulfuricurvum sp.]|nr:hypothetical protein [Sulfuricurvum sp.]